MHIIYIYINRQEKIGELVEMMKKKEEEVGQALTTLRVMKELMSEVQGVRSQQISSKDGEKMIFTESACQGTQWQTLLFFFNLISSKFKVVLIPLQKWLW